MLKKYTTPLFIALTAAQTFPGFVPQVFDPLVVKYTLNSSAPVFVSPVGRLMDMSVVASPPKIGVPTDFTLPDSPNGFLFLMIDPDALRPNQTNITTILHYIRGNFTLPPASSPTPDIAQNFTELVFPTNEPPLASMVGY